MISYGKCTKAQYEALTPVQDRIYYITDTGEQYLNGLPYNGEDNNDYFCVEMVGDEQTELTFQFKGTSSSPSHPELEYSFDKRNWTACTWTNNYTMTPVSIASKGKVWLRGNNDSFAQYSDLYYPFTFTSDGLHKVSGNIISLIDKTCKKTTLPNRCFMCLFTQDTNLVSAKDLKLLAMSVPEWAYEEMFYACTKLQDAPELPATSVAENSYGEMFYDCPLVSRIKVAFTSWPEYAFVNWVEGVAATGEFICPSALDTTTRDASHIPSGWSVIYTDIEASKSVPTPQSYSVLGMTRPVQTEAKQLRWSYSFDPGACLWLEAINSPVTVNAFLSATASETQTVDLWWSTNGVLWQKNTITAGQPLQFSINLLNRYEDSGNGTFSKRIYLWKAEPNSLRKCLLLYTSASVRVGGNLDSMTSTSTTGQTGPAYEFYRLLSNVKVAEFDQLVLPDRPLGDHALSQCFGASGTVGNNDQGIPLSPMIPVRSDHAATAFDNFWYTQLGDHGLQVSTVRFFNKSSSQVIVGGSADEGADQYGTPLPAYRNMGPSCMRGIVEMYGPSDTAIDIAHVFKSSAYYATRCVGMGEQKFVRNRGNRTSENLKSYAGYVYKLAVAASSTLTLGLDALTRFNTSSQGYIEAIIDCDATGTVAFGTGFGSNNDAIVQGKRNHVVVRVTQGVGRLFVVDTEDIPNA